MATKRNGKRATGREMTGRSTRRGGRLRRWLALGTLLTLAATAGWVWWLDREVTRFLEGRGETGVRVWSAPLELRAGIDVRGIRLAERLARLGYDPVAPEAPVGPGTYRVAPGRVDIGLRSYLDVGGVQPAEAVRLVLDGTAIEAVQRLDDGRSLARASLEPELLGSYGTGVGSGALGERDPVDLDELPGHVVHAVLAAEDERFAIHPGIDPIGIVRAAVTNLRSGSAQQGGSTITQQLAKNVFLSPERTWRRKVTEAVLAVILEVRLTKEEILETYLATVYFGRVGSVGIYGIAQAARAFFGKELREVDVVEAAAIAGIISSPNRHSPVRHPERATVQRDLVLERMAKRDWLAPEALETALATPLTPKPGGVLEAPFFVDEVFRRFRVLGWEPEQLRGLSLYTTVDLELQRMAERGVRNELAALERRFPTVRREGATLEGAFVLLDAHSGDVLALVGGRDFSRSQYNRATRAERQPGSAFKPFVYLAALDQHDHPLTAASVLGDEPVYVRTGGKTWAPKNHDGKFRGLVTVRTALAESRNVPAYRAAAHAGFERVAALARAAGLGEMPAVPSMALGVGEVTLLDLVGAYTVFPNHGVVVPPLLIRGIVDAEGTPLYQSPEAAHEVATPAAAYVMTSLLQGVIDHGTGAGVRRLGFKGPLAGKTGTTNDTRDAWFIGFSPDVVGGAWVGYDRNEKVRLTGAFAALPVWAAVMKEVLPAYTERRFPVPEGVSFADVEAATGLRAAYGCGTAIREAFVRGTEPVRSCQAAVQVVEPERGAEHGEEPRHAEGQRRGGSLVAVGRFFKGLFAR
jgi:penicillin-binding protein 1B